MLRTTLLASAATAFFLLPAHAAGDHTNTAGTAQDATQETPGSGEAAADMASEGIDASETPDGSADATPASPAMAEGGTAFADQEMGKRFEVNEVDLPEPDQAAAVRNPALTIDRGDDTPTAPDGFQVTLFADNLAHPRQILVLENGDVLLAEQAAGRVTFLRDTDDDGKADIVSRFAQNFEGPYGLAVAQGDNEGDILVADTRGIWRVPFTLGEIRASGPEIFYPEKLSNVPPEERVPQEPMDHFAVTEQGVFGEAVGHTTRSLALHPETGEMFVGVGSAGNIAVEPEPRATIQRFDADGTNQATYATGMRNPIGLAFHPDTKELWAVVQERDGLGNELVPDFLTKVEEGDFYGWPYSYTGSNPQPQFAERAPDGKVEEAKVGDVLFESHSAAMDFVFNTSDALPEEYEGDAFVALKGSWNRADPTGYKVVRVPFENGQPTGGYENFLTGFWVEGDDRAVVWGRPADIAQLPDGGLLVADDTAGTIWHVAHRGEVATSSDASEASQTQEAQPDEAAQQ